MNWRGFTLISLFVPSKLKAPLIRLIFGGLFLAGVVAFSFYNFDLLPGLEGGVVSTQSAVTPLPSPELAALAPQQVATAPAVPVPAPEKPAPQAAVKSNHSSGENETTTGSIVSNGKALYSLDELKNKKDLELAIRKLDNDITRENAKSNIFAKYPEAAAGIEIKKNDEGHNKGNIIEQMSPPPDPLEQVKFMGIIGEKAIWSLNNSQSTTRKGDWIAGYVVTSIANSGVTVEKNGKKVFFGLP